MHYYFTRCHAFATLETWQTAEIRCHFALTLPRRESTTMKVIIKMAKSILSPVTAI